MSTALELSKEMLSFIDQNPTAYHTVASVRRILLDNGYTELREGAAWKLAPGSKCFVCRNGSSIIAFRVGKKLDRYGFSIAASHTDSPCFRVKEVAELDGSKYIRLNTEGYGGMICSTWMDRPLSVAGRVLVRGENGSIESRLLKIDRDLLLIPSVAIHMNRAVNEGTSFNKQIDMLPLFCGTEKATLSGVIAEELGVAETDILGSDLFLYVRQVPAIWGAHNEFVSSGRLDDQQCVYTSLQGLLRSGNENSVSVLACFDNEEVGSGTKQGADSTFLADVLRRVNTALGKTEEDLLRAIACSFMLSADNAHAVHPNHPEHTDAGNCNYMNEGVVVKFHAGQKYCSDGMSVAIVRELAARAGVPLQYFANRSDKVGGSTLGNISMAHVSLNCADIGLPQLAMHSCYETAGVKDTGYMADLMTSLFNSSFEETDTGTKVL